MSEARLYVFFTARPGGEEGVAVAECAWDGEEQTIPLVAASEAQLGRITRIAETLQRRTRWPMRLVEFSEGREIRQVRALDG